MDQHVLTLLLAKRETNITADKTDVLSEVVGQSASGLRGVSTDSNRDIICKNEVLSGVKILIDKHEPQSGRDHATQGKRRETRNFGLGRRPRGSLSFTQKKRERSHWRMTSRCGHRSKMPGQHSSDESEPESKAPAMPKEAT